MGRVEFLISILGPKGEENKHYVHLLTMWNTETFKKEKGTFYLNILK